MRLGNLRLLGRTGGGTGAVWGVTDSSVDAKMMQARLGEALTEMVASLQDSTTPWWNRSRD